jgi:hypothetical protein
MASKTPEVRGSYFYVFLIDESVKRGQRESHLEASTEKDIKNNNTHL